MANRVTKGMALAGGLNASVFKLNNVEVTASAAELNKCDGIAATAYQVVTEEVTFTETTGAGTYTGSITVPAGATIIDIKIRSTALWTAATSATMKVGDAADDDGWFTGIDMKATDLLVGEEINFVQTGGKEGAYLSLTTGARTTAYSASARVVSGIVTTVGASGNAGRTRMMVIYALPTAVAATKA
jgi:hypothetical protein